MQEYGPAINLGGFVCLPTRSPGAGIIGSHGESRLSTESIIEVQDAVLEQVIGQGLTNDGHHNLGLA